MSEPRSAPGSDFFVHPNAICESMNIGSRSRIWAFAHVLPGARIGADANICDGVFVENDVVVGDRVTVKCGVQLWDGVRLADDVFVGPNATFTNDLFPRSRQYPAEFLTTEIGEGASIGANATILPGVHIGRRAMVGAGAVVTKNVPPNAIVVGNPAQITGYVDRRSGTTDRTRPGQSPARSDQPPAPVARPAAGPSDPGSTARTSVGVGRAELITLGRVDDLRGSLVATEFERDLPFAPRRSFLVFDVPTADVRGEHAHRVCEQLLICVRGRVTAMVDDGQDRRQVVLDRPDVGLYVPPMLWGSQYRYSADAVLLVYASAPYDPDDYIRDYEQFLIESSTGRS